MQKSAGGFFFNASLMVNKELFYESDPAYKDHSNHIYFWGGLGFGYTFKKKP
jgi:hypothetical protein